MPGGRPTKYQDDYPEQARKLCLLGSTNAQLAEFFEVDVSTIDKWIAEKPEFSGSIKEGREVADAEIANSLYHRGKGYSHKAVKIFLHKGKPVIVDYIEHYPPDTAAAFIWLKNRRRLDWKDRHSDDGNPNSNTLTIVYSPDAE